MTGGLRRLLVVLGDLGRFCRSRDTMSIIVCIEKWGTPNNKNGGWGSVDRLN